MAVIPKVFQSRTLLDTLSVLAVGASLAAATGAVFRTIMTGSREETLWITVPPTLIVGTLWARVLRWRKTLGASGVRAAWLLSVPLAALNASLAAGIMLANDHGSGNAILSFLMGMFLGATFGAVFWVPALVATLVVFGLPIARGQSLAEQGLAGQERGDGFVGGVCAVIASAAFASSLVGPHQPGMWLLWGVAALAWCVGLATMGLAWWRDRARRAFVSDVEAGRVEGYRVEDVPEGRVLVRVVHQGEGYRVADYAEEVAALDRDGAVTRAKE